MIGAIVLAAGRSERMGQSGQKLLLRIGGEPLIARVVEEVRSGPAQHLVVVTGRDHDRIAAALAGREVTLVRNPDLAGEMLGSVRCGVRALPEKCEAVFVIPGDLPGLDAGVMAALADAWRRTGSSLLVPAFEGRRGHPVLIGLQHRDEILTRHEGVGLRGLFRAHPGDVLEVRVASPGVLTDIDRPEDYRAWMAKEGRVAR